MMSHQVNNRFQFCSRSQEHIKSLISKYLQEKKKTREELEWDGVDRWTPVWLQLPEIRKTICAEYIWYLVSFSLIGDDSMRGRGGYENSLAALSN